MIWANFLHFYQPPTQKKYWVDRITDEAYRRIIRGLKENPEARLTLNINGILLELWERYGHEDVIQDLRDLLKKNQIELTGSAKYHSLLPKIPKEEVVRQIELNHHTLRKYLGESFSPRGFFPPEMAYHPDLAPILEDLGFEWVIVEELSLPGRVDYSKVYQVRGTNLKIFFRERGISYKILSGQLGTPKLFLDEILKRVQDDSTQYLLTAMDGETFGHHRPGMEKLLLDLYRMKNVGVDPRVDQHPANGRTQGSAPTRIRAVTISDLLDLGFPVEVVETRPATWALMEKDIQKNVPFARWDDPNNEIHKMQWKLTDLAIETVRSSKYQITDTTPFRLVLSNLEFRISGQRGKKLSVGERRWLKARYLLDRALHSDQYWWASARPWWSIEMIERGAKELLNTISAVPDVSHQTKNRAQNLYYRIITTGFDWQREGRVEELARKEDEDIRMRTDEGLPKLPKTELKKMISTIRKEMIEVAEAQEYERAAQLRDRIRELEGYIQ